MGNLNNSIEDTIPIDVESPVIVPSLGINIDTDALDCIKANLQVCRDNKYKIRCAIDKCDSNIKKVENSLLLLEKKVKKIEKKQKCKLSPDDLDKVNAKKKEMLLLLKKYTLYNEQCKEKLDLEVKAMINLNNSYTKLLSSERERTSLKKHIYPYKSLKDTLYIYDKLVLVPMTNTFIKVYTGEELKKLYKEDVNMKIKLRNYNLTLLTEYEIRGSYLNTDKLAKNLGIKLDDSTPDKIIEYVRFNYKLLYKNYKKNKNINKYKNHYINNNNNATDRFLAYIFNLYDLQDAFKLYGISNSKKPVLCSSSRYVLSYQSNKAYVTSLERVEMRGSIITNLDFNKENCYKLNQTSYIKPSLKIINSLDNNFYMSMIFNNKTVYVLVSPDAMTDKGSVPLYNLYVKNKNSICYSDFKK